MKLYSLFSRYIFIYICSFSLLITKITEKNSVLNEKISNKKEKQKIVTENDAFMIRFISYIKEFSTKRIRSENLYRKRLQSGNLQEGYPENMVKEAKKFRDNKENWKNLMSLPTAIWRSCIFPLNKMNYLNWCQNLYASKTKKEIKCN